MQVSVQRTRVRAMGRVAIGFIAAFALAACSTSIGEQTATSASPYQASSIANAGQAGLWTTPPSTSPQAYQSGTLRANPVSVVPTTTNRGRSGAVQTTPAGMAFDVPPPPPPPGATNIGYENWQAPAAPGGAVAPAPTYVGPGVAATAPGCAPAPVCAPCQPLAAVQPANPCWLPCENGISRWHVRGLIGFVTFAGEDPGEDCGYWGVDLGRTFCGCWGLDAFYRWNSGQFDRLNVNGGIDEDGGDWHHFGVKFTYEGRIGNNPRWTWWAGLGPEYFTTDGYIDDDSGFGIFGELGVSFAVTEAIRIRAGVGIHGVDTDVGRENPIDDGESRWLWIFGPHLGLEFSF